MEWWGMYTNWSGFKRGKERTWDSEWGELFPETDATGTKM